MWLRVLAALPLLAGCVPAPLAGAAEGTALDARFAPKLPLDPGAAARGKILVETRCSTCHSVGAAGQSPNPAAPPLRHLGTRYPVSHLQEAFAEGITNGHPAMPEITLEDGEIRDLIAYLQSVQNHSRP